MLMIPAIDLKDGQCVRLRQGLMEDATVFPGEPAEVAAHWVRLGARRLHLVDLNGAFAGRPANAAAIEAILSEVGDRLPVQLGGGIRDLATIERYLGLGLSQVILGTAAVKNPGFVHEACRAFPGKIMVGIDARDGLVAIDGWATVTDIRVDELARQFEQDGIVAVIYTDIGRDGMLSGVNVEATAQLARGLHTPVIASGGVTNLDDVRSLAKVAGDGVTGAITGRAIYEGTLDFQAAQALADQLTED